MKTWERDSYTVVEVPFDGDLHEFQIVKGGEVIATITPATIEDMETIIKDLDNGEDVNGWEDGMGNTISIPEKRITVKGVELDYTNLYNDAKVPVRFSATIIIDEYDGEKLIVDAISEETNETFGVEKGEHFDPGDTVTVADVLGE